MSPFMPVAICLHDQFSAHLGFVSCMRGPGRLRYFQTLVWRAIMASELHLVLQVAIDSMETIAHSPPESTTAPPIAPRRSYFREVPWRWSDVFIAFLPIIVKRLGPALPPVVPGWFRYALYLLTFVWMLAFPLLIARRRLARWPRLPAPRVLFRETLIALAAAVVGLLTLIVVPQCLFWLFGETAIPADPFEPIVRSPARLKFLSFMILAVTLGPLAEEVLFRGLLYNAVRQKLHVIVAVPLQAVVFGFYHPFGVVFSSTIAVGALVIVAVYEWRKTLLTPVLKHAFVNCMGLLLITSGFTADANAPRLGLYGSAHDGGCLVTDVVPDSAAEKAGLQTGDVVVAVDGKPVTDIPSIFRIIRTKHLGDTVAVEFLRAGKTHRVEAVLSALRQ